MDYIILDMEWNQPYSKKKKIVGTTILSGEIIQIGAVKIDENFQIIDTFNESVKPTFYKDINRHVKKITGLTTAMLKNCSAFPYVYTRFKKFCGVGYCFITWGPDDLPMLRDNMEAHGINPSELPRCYNLQSIFNTQISHESRQWSLESAMQKLEIEQKLTPHDALSDAKNTALIAAKLDMKKGIEQYGRLDNSGISCSTILTSVSNGYLSLMDAHRQSIRTKTVCPFCKDELETKGWIGKRSKRIALASCQDHGTFKFQNVIYKHGELYYIKKKITYASDDMKKSYAEKILEKETAEVM